MIDSITKERVVIYGGDTGHPYLYVPEEQLGTVTEALRRHNVDYAVEDEVISIDDDPPVAVVNLDRNADVGVVQRILDGI